jgi:hypothetical protein
MDVQEQNPVMGFLPPANVQLTGAKGNSAACELRETAGNVTPKGADADADDEDLRAVPLAQRLHDLRDLRDSMKNAAVVAAPGNKAALDLGY